MDKQLGLSYKIQNICGEDQTSRTNRLKIDENELEIIEDFLKKMLEYNENIRLSAEELLNHEWFHTRHLITS